MAETGFNEPPTCMSANCGAPGTYSSFGTCESKKIHSQLTSYFNKKACPTRCATCTDPGTCNTCKPGNYPLNGACLGIIYFESSIE